MPILELGNPRFGEGKGGAQEAMVPAVTLASLLLPAPQPLGPGGRVLGVSRPQFYLLQKWNKKVSHMRWSQEISAFQAVKLFPWGVLEMGSGICCSLGKKNWGFQS